MLNKIKNWLLASGICLCLLFLVWFVISVIVFRFRHPWVTDTEIWINFPKALMFEKVSYSEMRK